VFQTTTPFTTASSVFTGQFDSRSAALLATVLSTAAPLTPATANILFPEVARPVAADGLPFQAFPARSFGWRFLTDPSDSALNVVPDMKPDVGADRDAAPVVPPAVAPPVAEPAPQAPALGTDSSDAATAFPLSSSAAASAAEEQPTESSPLLGLILFASGMALRDGDRKRRLPALPRD
jgi:hypothetical protein